MISKTPIEINKIKQEDIDKEILRLAIIAELDAINLYEQLTNNTKTQKIKKILLDIAKEEKTHVGELLTLLLQIDPQQQEEIQKGKQETEEILKE
jgi:rubrerythrin